LDDKDEDLHRLARLRQAKESLRDGDVNIHLLADSNPQLAWMDQPDGSILS
jgi:hypothetical protein